MRTPKDLIVAGAAAPSAGIHAQDVSASRTGLVTFTFDDGSLDQVVNALPVMRKFGIKGTLFVITKDTVDATADVAAGEQKDRRRRTWPELKRWSDAGWEIGAHTHTHPHLPELSPDTVRQEMAYSAALIARHTGTYPVSFASPYGEINDTVIATAKDLFESHVAWRRIKPPDYGGGFNSTVAIDPYHIVRLGMTRDTQVERVCDFFARAGRERLWFVVNFHRIVPVPRQGSDGLYECPVASLERIAGCAAKAAAQGVIKIVTVKEALTRIPHLDSAADAESQ